MSRRREPVAEIGADDFLIVCHTHDIEQARTLMLAKLTEEHVRDMGALADDEYEPHVEGGRQVYMRKVARLPGSLAEAEGWAFEYRECKPGPGAFPAVVFR